MFEQWMNKVDTIVWQTVGCSVYDLPDCLYRVWYDDEMSASEAAKRAIERGR